ncbi:hypothetical protein OV090_19735 [Nannocystis sp. RBIL2]|uniref:hypothetical protein n=1 Tax=Nannocystis sp. RBIL2 TaxID=2996788 RepID=UPI00226F4589|nr:hypothetical protein [Nannocystis sp. RBIL2]MCY1067013.1 hypothetical protein [Nannocystis sp. RBIL2]
MSAASRTLAVAAALVLGPLVAGPARADNLHIDVQSNPERNFTPVQELAYEAIVAGVDGYKVDLRLRVTLHNASKRRQDAVLSLALPRDAELFGLAVARDGTWSSGRAAGVAVEPAHRASGTVFARALAPAVAGDLPAAEVVVFNLEPEATIQIELQLKAPPRLRADHWELELPSRGDDRWGLAPERRVVVQGARPGDIPRFWLDDRASDGAGVLLSRPEDRSLVSWPYKHVSKDRGILDGHLELLPDPTPPGVKASGGRFRAYLRLGAAPPPRPDHVVVVLDRSRSTAPDLHRDAFAALTGLFDELPPTLTFDAISFARTARPLLADGEFPSVRDRGARDRVAAALDAGAREQGTDLAAALALAGRRIAARDAHRPLVVVITDGMLPAGIGAQQIGHVFSDSLEKKSTRPELLFIVDEPMMLRGGITPQHPITSVATALGARISLESLAQHARRSGGEPPEGLTEALLAAPAVLSDLELQLPRRAALDEPAPGGLVAGNVLVVRGHYTGAPPSVGVRGKLAGVRTSRTLRAVASRPPPAALVASFGVSDLDRAAADGFTRPPWFGLNQQRVARLGITWAGRGNGDERGFLDEKIFRNYLGIRVFPRARACFNKALTRDKQLGGKVVFELEVGKGEVMLARVDAAGLNHREPGFEACLLEAAWALEIPAGRLDDQIYRLRYPVVFNPPAGGRPAMEDDPLGPGTVELLLGLPNR